MIQQEQDGLFVSVSVTGPKPPSISRFEAFVVRLGGPDRITRVCDAINWLCIAFGLLFIAAWYVTLRGVFLRQFHPTDAEAFFLGFAWAPVYAAQLFTGAVRYSVITIQLKTAQQLAQNATAQFFQGVSMCVQETLQRFVEGREAEDPKGPTLQ